MKKVFYFMVFTAFLSCQENKDKEVENQLRGVEVNKQAKSGNSGQPPADNAIMRELLSAKKDDLNRIDQLYIKTIKEAKDEEYLDNLKQYGFILLMKHGLSDKGTKEQKLYYINEQLHSQANFAVVADFYALLKSDLGLPVRELKRIENLFYTKNNGLISTLDWPDKNAKLEKLRELGYRHLLFTQYINGLER